MLGTKMKLLGLSVLALAVMAISAGAAQAETGAFWLVNGAKISESLLPKVGGNFDKTVGKLLAKLGVNLFHVTCTEFTPIGVHLVEPNGSALGRIKFSGCKFFSLNSKGVATELGACEPNNGGTEPGVVLTLEAKGLILLHTGGIQVFDIEPKEGTTFATIESTKECSFGQQVKVGGKFAVKDCEGKFLVDQVNHLIEELPALTKLSINGNEANTASIDGSAIVFLTGTHLNSTWAGHS